MATPHNSANKKDIAKIVLMVGDPIRAKKIAEKYLQDLKLVNNVRGMNTFTGKINGKRITIMPHGMGCPSVGIYTYELFKFYGVERIVRFGTIGALKGDTKVGTVIVANKTYTKTNYDDFYIKNGATYVSANEELVEKAISSLNRNLQVSKIFFKVELGTMNEIQSKEALLEGASFVKEKSGVYNAVRHIHASGSVKYDLVGKLVAETGLTRKAVVEILTGIEKPVFDQFKDNPEEFIIKAADLMLKTACSASRSARSKGHAVWIF